MFLAAVALALYFPASAQAVSFGPISSIKHKVQQLRDKIDSNKKTSTAPPLPGFVFFMKPSGTHVYTVQSSTIDIEGDSFHLGSLRWSNSRGGSGAIAVADRWSASSVPLQPLDNVITAVGTDYSGNISVDTITITYNSNLNFLSYARAEPIAFFVNEPTDIAFSIAIDTNSGQLVSGSVKVHQVDASNNIIDPAPFPVVLYDDGTHGDFVINDATFTAIANLTEASTGTLRLRISADTNGGSGVVTAYSEVFLLSVFTHITPTQYSAASDMHAQLGQQYEGFKINFGTEAAQTKALEWLRAQDNVDVAGRTLSGNGLWYILDSGVQGMMIDVPPGTLGSASVTPKATALGGLKSASSVRPMQFKPLSASPSSQDLIGNNKAIVLNAFEGVGHEEIRLILTSAGLTVTPIDHATIYDFMNLGGYGVVEATTHGSLYPPATDEFYKSKRSECKTNLANAQVLVTETLVEPTMTDLVNTQLYYQLCLLVDVTFPLNPFVHYLAVTPAFIEMSNGMLPNSIVYMNACHSLETPALAGAFRKLGASDFLGYSKRVQQEFAFNRAESFFQLLSNGEAAAQAHSANSSPDEGRMGLINGGYFAQLLQLGNGSTYMVQNFAVSKAGTGSGTVTSSPPGINCGGTCTAVFAPQTTVTLTATAAGDSTFTGWNVGGCYGTSCSLMLYPTHTVTATFSLTPPSVKKWEFTTGGMVQSSPAIGSDGTVYVGSGDGKLYAINPNGTQKWAFPTGSRIDSSPAIGSDGTVYVGSGDGKLYAINPNGTQKWAFPTGSSIVSSPAIGSDGTVYVGSEDGNLYAINPDGTQKWAFPTGSSIMSSPATGPDGTVYVGSYNNNLYAINPNGTQKWTFPTGGYIASSPAIGSDGTVYVGSAYPGLYAINPDGTQKWAFPIGGSILSSPAIGSDGTVYVGSADNNLRAINPDGTQKWIFPIGGGLFPDIESSPAISSDGTIFVGSFDNKLYAINPDGTPKWVFAMALASGNLIFSSPTIGSDGTVYVGNRDGKLYAIYGSGTLANTSWPKFHRDLQNTGRHP